MSQGKDLFDESTMSFGEHLEALRTHLWKAIIGFVIAIIGCLFFSSEIVGFVREPVDRALIKLDFPNTPYTELPGFDPWDYAKYHWNWFGGWPEESKENEVEEELPENTIAVKVKANGFYAALKQISPKLVEDVDPPKDDQLVELQLAARELGELKTIRSKQTKPVTLTVQEAFMTYLKVAMLAGFLFASPWIFYQIWLFVAAGLYPHERSYVYKFLPMSIILFLSGSAFCFFFVFPFILRFLLGFNETLEVEAQIRLSEWISFAVLLPVMFGLSFQLPMVMLLLERLQIFTVETYRAKRRMAVLVIAVLSMMLTPADPGSMMAMMLPLIVLYEFGIVLCNFRPAAKSPFEEAPA